jgi:hypothetical protein
VVRLKGYLKCPAVVDPSFTPMFQLPAGYRPDETRLRVVGTFNATPGQLEITGDGYVAPTARPNAANILISIDGISFRCGPSGVDGCP